MESAVYLALAVILFRGFVAEGYMISTGSMAPCLVGYHRQIVCPSCSFAFSRGTHYSEPESVLAGSRSASDIDLGGDELSPSTICPNCGLAAIDTSAVPRNEGDQLLVQKHLYQLRSPRRWEVVVFRHPNDPAQAYVKRVVGLPNETLTLREGDVYADGQVQRKPLATQRSMRIPVYDHDHAPTDADWQPRWQSAADSSWSGVGPGFVHRRLDPGDNRPDDVDWLTYHHWIRSGGPHRTAVELSTWPVDLRPSSALDRRLHFDPQSGQLEFDGVLPAHTAERLRRASTDDRWLAAIDQLEIESHESPVGDVYGYNHPESGDGLFAVHDLMLEVLVGQVAGMGELHLVLTDGWHEFETVFDYAAREVRLHLDGAIAAIASGPFPEAAFSGQESCIEVSLFDRQVLVAVDGVLPFAPLPYAAEDRPRALTSRPVRVGAAGVDLQVTHLRLYRDVYYTPKPSPESDVAYELGPDEFYVLGDNSPVSVDSRAWDSPAIPGELLIGKPFLVHLPSTQGRLELAGDIHHIRIPDFSRVRYIR